MDWENWVRLRTMRSVRRSQHFKLKTYNSEQSLCQQDIPSIFTLHTLRSAPRLACHYRDQVLLLLLLPPAAIHLIGLWKTLISLLVVVFVLTPLHSLPAKNWSASQSNLATSDQHSEPCKHITEPPRPGQRATRKTCCNQKGPSGLFPQWGFW